LQVGKVGRSAGDVAPPPEMAPAVPGGVAVEIRPLFRVKEMQRCPQFIGPVLYRGAGQGQLAFCHQARFDLLAVLLRAFAWGVADDGFGPGGIAVFDLMRLIKHNQIPRSGPQPFAVPGHDVVVNHNHVRFREFGSAGNPDGHGPGQPLFGLARPVGLEAGLGDNQHVLNRRVGIDDAKGLNRLAKTHFIRNQAGRFVLGKGDSGELERHVLASVPGGDFKVGGGGLGRGKGLLAVGGVRHRLPPLDNPLSAVGFGDGDAGGFQVGLVIRPRPPEVGLGPGGSQQARAVLGEHLTRRRPVGKGFNERGHGVLRTRHTATTRPLASGR